MSLLNDRVMSIMRHKRSFSMTIRPLQRLRVNVLIFSLLEIVLGSLEILISYRSISARDHRAVRFFDLIAHWGMGFSISLFLALELVVLILHLFHPFGLCVLISWRCIIALNVEFLHTSVVVVLSLVVLNVFHRSWVKIMSSLNSIYVWWILHLVSCIITSLHRWHLARISTELFIWIVQRLRSSIW